MGKLRFLLALWLAKLSVPALKITRHNGTDFPGSLALKLYPDFLRYVGKPGTIIAVTGTNGKTTVSNLLTDLLEADGKKVLSNRSGSNITSGISTALLRGCDLLGRAKSCDMAVLEVDERASVRIFPYVKPDYVVVTNLTRDSIMRNAHPGYIADILTRSIPQTATMILNADDLITCGVAPAVIFYNVYECGSDDEDTASETVDTSAAGANVLIADGTINNVTGSYVARIYDPDSVVLSEDGMTVEDSEKLHKYDGAFYSKMSMNVDGGEAGTGVLNITADNEGLDTELHLTINGGTINITSGNDGINTNEDNVSVTTVNGGSVNIQVAGETGEGDGIDSNGWLVINGGAVTAAACSDSGDAGIDATMGITINGGTVAASGNMYDQIDGGAQNYVVFSFASRQNGGQTYTLQNADGETVGTWTPANDFTCLVVSSPDLTAGDYTLWQGDTQLAGTMSDGVGSPGGGRHMGGEAPPADLDPWQAPEGEVPENAGSEVPDDPPERPDGEMEPDGRESPAGGHGPGGGEGGQSAAGLSKTFTLSDGGSFFNGLSPTETTEASET